MKIILIRHGETSLNAKKRYAGWTDCPLSAKGKKQAQKVGRTLAGVPVRKIYASDLRRAEEFAEIAFKGAPIEQFFELREINFGIFEGMTHKEISKKYPLVYTRWLADPSRVVIPEGESLGTLKKRVKYFFNRRLRLRSGETAVVVTHAGPIKIMVEDLLRSKKFWDIQVDNAAISVIDRKNGKRILRKFNDTSFL